MTCDTGYSRVLIEGCLRLRSKLALRSGETAPGRGLDIDEADTIPEVALVTATPAGAYIPGSSLKGALRAWAVANLAISADEIFQIFGRKAEPAREEQDPSDGQQRVADGQSEGGKLEVWDAFAESDMVVVRGATRIERATRVASHEKLRYGEEVAAQTEFRVRLTGDALTDGEIAIVLAALLGFNASHAPIALGGGRSAGLGLADWDGPSLYVMDRPALSRWLADSRVPPWMDWLRAETAPVSVADLPSIAHADRAPQIEITVRLVFDGPFLVAEPVPASEREDAWQAVPWQERRDTPTRAPGRPNLRPLRQPDAAKPETEWGPLLPGSSVRGALRSQAERIWRTVKTPRELDDEGRCRSDDGKGTSITRIFGCTDAAGLLTVSDFVPVAACAGLETQDFVAVDRFTGGAKDGAKFMIEMAPQPTLEGTLRLRLKGPRYRPASGGPDNEAVPRSIRKGDLGLLALLLRDLVEGDLTFGFGRNKGYGACRAQIRSLSLPGTASGHAADGDWLSGRDVNDRWAARLNRAVRAFRAEEHS